MQGRWEFLQGMASAQQLAELFTFVETVPPVSVPGDSILRETIGSSQLTC